MFTSRAEWLEKVRMQDFVVAHTDSGTVGTVSVGGGDKGRDKKRLVQLLMNLGESWI